ncbi:MAG: glycerol-3-phosphate acyltransferase [Anaerolineales bacterium]|nr:glycerol-3-phosphate acyltransferase [Anaerolineales bacterium]
MTVQIIGMLIGAYLIGSIPFGFIIVKITSGEDIRTIQSGRTGGTNTWRAAGFIPGFSTAFLDIGKAASAVTIARVLPAFSNPWLLILVPILVIIGNNYSFFMVSRDKDGKVNFGGGAGGAACLGGAVGLWWPSGLIILGVGILIYYFVGYASVTTMWVALGATLIFSYRAVFLGSPWAFAVYGLAAEGLLVLSLLPNIRRLLAGTERLHGFRAKQIKNQEKFS